MTLRTKRHKDKRARPEQTAMAVWVPTKELFDKIQDKIEAGSGVKALDMVAREQAARLDIPFVVTEGVASPA